MFLPTSGSTSLVGLRVAEEALVLGWVQGLGGFEFRVVCRTLQDGFAKHAADMQGFHCGILVLNFRTWAFRVCCLGISCCARQLEFWGPETGFTAWVFGVNIIREVALGLGFRIWSSGILFIIALWARVVDPVRNPHSADRGLSSLVCLKVVGWHSFAPPTTDPEL